MHNVCCPGKRDSSKQPVDIEAVTCQNNSCTRPRKPKTDIEVRREANLRAVGQDPDIHFWVTLRRIHSETMRLLEAYAVEVRECKNVQEASRFCRWLQMSGITSLLESHPQEDVDFRTLARKSQDIVFDCGEFFKGGKVSPRYAESDITEIHKRLDFLTSIFQKPICQPSATVTEAILVSTEPQKLIGGLAT
jgi:hypothetical protein